MLICNKVEGLECKNFLIFVSWGLHTSGPGKLWDHVNSGKNICIFLRIKNLTISLSSEIP